MIGFKDGARIIHQYQRKWELVDKKIGNVGINKICCYRNLAGFAYNNGTVRIQNLDTGEVIQQKYKSTAYCVAVCENLAVSSHRNYALNIWNLKTGAVESKNFNAVIDNIFINNGLIICASRTGRVYIYDIETGRIKATKFRCIRCCTLYKGCLIMIDERLNYTIWNLKTERGPTLSPLTLISALFAKKDYLIMGHAFGNIKVRSTEYTWICNFDGRVKSVSMYGNTVVSGHDNNVYIWNLGTDQVIIKPYSSYISCICKNMIFLADDNAFVTLKI
jgi:WD40 repeat protein